MARSKYSRGLKIKVAKEAMLPENQGLEHVIAEKYHVMPWTVIKWRDHLQQVGEENAFKKGYTLKKRSTPREVELEKENAQLREEVEILKKQRPDPYPPLLFSHGLVLAKSFRLTN